MFMDYYDSENYNVDYDYYINQAYKIIHNVDGTVERVETERRAEVVRLKQEKEENDYRVYCLDKVPTNRQREMYSKSWLVEKYGYPKSKEELKDNK